MRYGSVCSGVEAATVAWHALGWTPAFFAEIDRFPSEVLAHHYGSNLPGEPLSRNAPPNLGDMTRFQEWPDATLDVLVGGTPCQSFSVAGLRKGLADPRGNLALTYLAILDRYRPEWMVWENVPGVLSSGGGRDFGSFLGGLGELGYRFAYRVLDAQYVRVDGYGRAVPQRRRRVFVVGHSGDWRRAAAVLFERASLCGDTAPRREAGKRVAPTVAGGARTSGGYSTDDIPLTEAFGGNRQSGALDVATAVNAHGGPHGRLDFESETFVTSREVAATLTRGAESAGKGGYAGRRQEDDENLIAFDTTQITSASNYSQPKPGGPCHPLAAGAHPPAVALFDDPRRFNNVHGGGAHGDFHPTLESTNPKQIAVQGWAVRRLTPTECERLQGFPDGYTAILRKGKPAADGPRYKALGNSMACNVMRWIGRRIEMVDGLARDLSKGEAA